MIRNKNYKIGEKNIKIALLSDLHFNKEYDYQILEKVIINLKENNPDYICISGDIIDDSLIIKEKEVMLKLKEFIKNLSNISSVIVSLGNHDIKEKNKEADFNAVNEWFLGLNKIENVYYLNNKSLVRNDICFTSYNPPYSYYKSHENYKILLEDIDNKIHLNKKYYNILLVHSPIAISKKEVLKNSKNLKNANLILSGHMHNGLVFNFLDFKSNIGFISPQKKLFPLVAKGLVKLNNEEKTNFLVISGGVVKITTSHSHILSRFNKLYPIHIEYVII